MAQYCGQCIHYKERSYKICWGQKNVSGGVVWYRIWSKFRCELGKCQGKKNYQCAFFVGNADYQRRKKKYEEFKREFVGDKINAKTENKG